MAEPVSLKDHFEVHDAEPLCCGNFPKGCSKAWWVCKHDMMVGVVVFVVDKFSPYVCTDCFFHSNRQESREWCVHVERIRETNPMHVVPHPLNMTAEKVKHILQLVQHFNEILIRGRDKRLNQCLLKVINSENDEENPLPFPWGGIEGSKAVENISLGVEERKLLLLEKEVWPLMFHALQQRRINRIGFEDFFKNPFKWTKLVETIVNFFDHKDVVREKCIQEQRLLEAEEGVKENIPPTDENAPVAKKDTYMYDKIREDANKREREYWQRHSRPDEEETDPDAEDSDE